MDLGLALLAVSLAATITGIASKGKRVLLPFDFHGVTLDDGRMRREFDEVRDYYLNIPLDDLMHGYRVRAGLPAPGQELGGWYTGDMGNVFPQILSGLARMYAATGDRACLEKANAMLTEWAKCIGPDGYPMYSNHPTSKQYYYEKVVGAMVDMDLYCGRKDALDYLSTVTDWAIKTLKRDREYANANGDINNPLCDHSEWYTVSENLYRAYLLTGNAKYRDFGKVWEYTKYWNIFARKGDIFALRPDGGQTDTYHAYSHVNTFSSDAASYLVYGEGHYLDTLKNAYDYLQLSQVFATGGYGPNEQLTYPDRVASMLRTTNDSFETQCGSWAAFKMSKYLISLTGDAKYGDWVERLVLNGTGSSLHMTTDGRITYYSNYRVGGASKELYDGGWSCCTGTRPLAVADYFDQVYFRSASSLCVNLYTPSSVRFDVGGNPIEVRQKTRFPESMKSVLTVSLHKPTRLALKFRIPQWLAEPMKANINGEASQLQVDADHWATVDRVWRDGDTIVIELPARIWVSRFGSGVQAAAALMYGPVVLAARALDGDPASKIDFLHPESCLTPCDGEPLSFRLSSDPNVVFRPYYGFRQGEKYFMYFAQGHS